MQRGGALRACVGAGEGGVLAGARQRLPQALDRKPLRLCESAAARRPRLVRPVVRRAVRQPVRVLCKSGPHPRAASVRGVGRGGLSGAPEGGSSRGGGWKQPRRRGAAVDGPSSWRVARAWSGSTEYVNGILTPHVAWWPTALARPPSAYRHCARTRRNRRGRAEAGMRAVPGQCRHGPAGVPSRWGRGGRMARESRRCATVFGESIRETAGSAQAADRTASAALPDGRKEGLEAVGCTGSYGQPYGYRGGREGHSV